LFFYLSKLSTPVPLDAEHAIVRADVGRVVEVEIPGSLPQQYFTASDSAAPEAFQVTVSHAVFSRKRLGHKVEFKYVDKN
jgi:hypothetical protein